MRTIGDIGEVAFLELALRNTESTLPSTVRGVGGDAAMISSEEGALAVSTDAAVEGVHFDLSFMTLEDAAWRAIVGALGDLAAVGTSPRAILLSCGLRRDLPVADALGIFRAAKRLSRLYGFDLVGGDVVESPDSLFMDVVVLGRVLGRCASPDRVGARPGDVLAVTGRLGSARAGLDALRAGRPVVRRGAIGAFLRPRPPLEIGLLLANSGVSAMTDISDGLAAELFSLARANPDVELEVDRWAVPLGPGVRDAARRSSEHPGDYALRGGEDSELLVALSPAAFDALVGPGRGGGDPSLFQVGRVGMSTPGPAASRVRWRTEPGALPRILPIGGHEHMIG